MNEVFTKFYEEWANKMIETYLEPYGFDRVRIVPKSSWHRLKQWIHIEPKRYRNKAQQGYVMTKDWMGNPIQVKKSEYIKPTKGPKTITFNRYSEL